MKLSRLTRWSIGVAASLALCSTTWGEESGLPVHAKAPRKREFRFDYGATLSGLPANELVRVWLPVPQNNRHQQVRILTSKFPAPAKRNTEPKYGNEMFYFETRSPASGRVSFNVSYQIQRQEVCGLTSDSSDVAELSEAERKRFLASNVRVPVVGKHLDLIASLRFPSEPLLRARILYDWVDGHVRYDKSKPGYGRGDVAWVCDSRFGNCTDFHSLFISLARSKGLPARFENGFPLPPQRGSGTVGGYHCWALFHVKQHGWVPIDISEADKHPELKQYYFGNLTEDRLTLTTGRDIHLVPQQSAPPLNFFVYPHVEVGGQTVPKSQQKLDFFFRDE